MSRLTNRAYKIATGRTRVERDRMNHNHESLGRRRGKPAAPSRPTIKDVASRCGVHPSTVSRALSPAMSHLVADDVAKRIRATAAALGYRPNVTAAGLRTGRSGLIGVLVPDIADPGFPPILGGVTERSEEHTSELQSHV